MPRRGLVPCIGRDRTDIVVKLSGPFRWSKPPPPAGGAAVSEAPSRVQKGEKAVWHAAGRAWPGHFSMQASKAFCPA